MKNMLVILLMFISWPVSCQNFAGKIVYQNIYKSKLPNLTDPQMNDVLGNTMEYFIQGGDYKTIMNGSILQWQLYLNKDNKLYTKFANTETIFWNDGSLNQDEVIQTELNEATTEVLGYTCDELILTCKSGIQKYYFNKTLSIEAKLFTNHKYGNWAEYLVMANALPLKTIIENEQFHLESIASEIVNMNLDSKFFELPPNAVTAKSPY